MRAGGALCRRRAARRSAQRRASFAGAAAAHRRRRRADRALAAEHLRYVLAPATPVPDGRVRRAPGSSWGGGGRALPAARRAARPGWPLVSVLAYALALAPVLLAGRTTHVLLMTLSDSAVHLIGADFLIRHGQHYTHLDLRNSYGQFINNYYNTSYPSGADTLFGGSAFLLGLPADLGLPAVQRVHARHRRRARLAARAAHGPAGRLGGAGGAHAPSCPRSSTPTSCSAPSRRSPRCP